MGVGPVNTRAPCVLAVESSCDETAAAVLCGQRVLANVVASQVSIHAAFGGVVPELASRNHLTALAPVLNQALLEASLTLEELDALAVTVGPGLAGCLLVGLQTVKTLAWAKGLPLVPVDHIAAHVHAVFLVDDDDESVSVPAFPYVALAVSGGHTSLIRVDAPGRLVVLGGTRDDAAGEAFDKVAKLMGLPYPGGAQIDRLAQQGDPLAVPLPRPMLHRGLEFSFSGLKTAVRYALQENPELAPCDLAASFQEAVAEVLVVKAIRACAQTELPRLVLAGGVACNSRLRALARERADKAGVALYVADPAYCTDNAAMVGGLASALLAQGEGLAGDAALDLDIYTRQRPSR